MPPPAPVPSAPAAHAESERQCNERAGACTQAPARRHASAPAAPAAPVAPAAPAIAATVSEANAREIVVETTQGQGGVLESRRDARALDPEGVPHRRRAAARSRARRRRRGCDQAVHADRRRSGDHRALERRDLSRHRQRRARGRDGRCDRVAANDRVRDGVRRRLEASRRRSPSSRRATSCRSAPSCRWAGSA